jgi:hypothetical protein
MFVLAELSAWHLPVTEIVPSKVSARLAEFLYLKMEAELASKM